MAGVYYRLSREMALRGWDGLPWAIVHRPDNGVRFLKEEEFKALELCGGLVDCSGARIPEQVRRLIGQMADEGVVERCAYGEGMEQDQYYRRYPNRFIYAACWSVAGRCGGCRGQCPAASKEEQCGQLSHEQVMDMIERMDECGVLSVWITGGEPLTRPDWWEIVDALADRRIDISCIRTNGMEVDLPLLMGLEARGMRPEFRIGYNGDQGWHDRFCGVPGAGRRVLEAFRACRERRFKTTAEMALHRGSVGVLRQSVKTLAASGCTGLKVRNATQEELRGRYSGDSFLPLEEMYEIYEWYIPQYFMDGSPLRLELDGAFMCGRGSRDFIIPVEGREGADICLCRPVCGCAPMLVEEPDACRTNRNPHRRLLFGDGWAERIRAAAAVG